MKTQSKSSKNILFATLAIFGVITILGSAFIYKISSAKETEEKTKAALRQRMTANFLIVFRFQVPDSERKEDEKLKDMWVVMGKLHKDRLWYKYKGKITQPISTEVAPLLDKGKELFSKYIYKLDDGSKTAENIRKTDAENKRLLVMIENRIEFAENILDYFKISLNPIPTKEELLTEVIEEQSQKQFGYKLNNENARWLAERILGLETENNQKEK